MSQDPGAGVQLLSLAALTSDKDVEKVKRLLASGCSTTHVDAVSTGLMGALYLSAESSCSRSSSQLKRSGCRLGALPCTSRPRTARLASFTPCWPLARTPTPAIRCAGSLSSQC